MTINLKVIAGLILVIILLGAYSYLLNSKIGTLEAKLSASEKTLVLLRQSLNSQYKELQNRQNELETVKNEREERDKEYEEVKTNDFESCDWASAPIPGAIVNFLCKTP
jgi:peptidoglycan hydrolase CwlO-like protein